MTDSDKVFAGSIPEVYDSYLVPLIFESFAVDMAQRVTRDGPDRVLETAAGSGVVTRAMAPLLNRSAQYVVTDLNQPMLDRAATRQGEDDRITWQQADALKLPFADEAFDAVCCQFGVMFFPDRVAGYREAKRVLKPGASSSSIHGTKSVRTSLPMTSQKRSRKYFPTIHHCSSPERRMVITTSTRCAANSR